MPAVTMLFWRHLSWLMATHRWARRIHGAAFVSILSFQLKHVHALSVILWNKFFCCLANSQLLVVCMHVCEHTSSHHFNVKIVLNISGLGALHTGRDAL